MAVTLTPTAAQHVSAHLAKRGKGVGLRLGVRTTGCSGLAYKIEYADDAKPEDLKFESHGVMVVIDPKSLPYLDGARLRARRAQRGLQVQQPERKRRMRVRRVL
jgi:iron-sulfur cluster assembly protein